MKLTCLLIIALCLPLLLCGPVMAQHSGPYVGAFLGVNALMDAKASDDLGEFGLSFDPFLLGSAVLGWDFEPDNPVGEGRVELEYTRRSNPLDQVTFAEGSFKGGGDVTADSLLLNFFAVFHDNSRFSPYAGLGIGTARLKASGLQVTGHLMSNDSAVVFAYQLGAGIDFALASHVNLDIGYRFFSCSRPAFSEANRDRFEMDYTSHNAVFGLRLGF